MSVTVKGRVKTISQEQTINSGAKPFVFKELFLETEIESQYPQIINIQFAGRSAESLDNINSSDIVEVEINLKGRLHAPTGKVFNTLSGWKVRTISKGLGAQLSQQPAQSQTAYVSPHQENVNKYSNQPAQALPQKTTIAEVVDDLPF